MDTASTPAPRLATAFHYVVARSVGAGFGAIKLNKAIVAADREFYRRHGRTLTGSTSFQKQRLGPVPNGVLVAIKNLIHDGKIARQEVLTPAGMRNGFIPLTEPDVEAFTAAEIDVLNMAIAALERVSAQQASDQTHDVLWDETDMLDQIPVRAAAFPPAQIDPEAMAWATEPSN